MTGKGEMRKVGGFVLELVSRRLQPAECRAWHWGENGKAVVLCRGGNAERQVQSV